ncbi:VanZ family protein [Streptomyces sp. SID3343]|uniref:VanZ family protein n=1 Tax=Streptomyces sp. SID3343 TaxID=2690260 RepID=UPI001371C1A9|nr:VanZ family protein [Streptomyces sp. SID3343]MYV98525.1 VanZ family protein [Streptomyces sp. SID3343]
MGRDRLAYWAFAAAVVLNLVILFNPGSPGDPATFIPHRDKIVHFLSFSAIAWTGRRVGISPLVLGIALAAHAVESELVQHFVLPHRSGDPWDAAADLLGATAGLVFATRLRRGAAHRDSVVAGS